MFSYPNIIVFEKIVNLGHEIFEFLYIMFIYGRYLYRGTRNTSRIVFFTKNVINLLYYLEG